MRWLVVDSLYCPEAYRWGHLDSYAYYLSEMGERVMRHTPTPFQLSPYDRDDLYWVHRPDLHHDDPDVAFVLDRYGDVPPGTVRVAQVAAICNPMPWQVRRPDGTPAYDLIISSLRWMVDEARAAGCRAEWQPLAFDTRALVAGMGVKRDLDTIFVGSLTSNHVARCSAVSRGLEAGTLTVFPPTFGRAYFALLARARSVLNVHAEWARGELNNMRMYEAAGMGATPIDVDGRPQTSTEDVLMRHKYTDRIPQLIAWAREIYEEKR